LFFKQKFKKSATTTSSKAVKIGDNFKSNLIDRRKTGPNLTPETKLKKFNQRKGVDSCDLTLTFSLHQPQFLPTTSIETTQRTLYISVLLLTGTRYTFYRSISNSSFLPLHHHLNHLNPPNMRATLSTTIKAVAFLAFATGSNAFWRMECRARSGLARIDPLVDFGGVSGHAHAIHGGNGTSLPPCTLPSQSIFRWEIESLHLLTMRPYRFLP